MLIADERTIGPADQRALNEFVRVSKMEEDEKIENLRRMHREKEKLKLDGE